MSTSPTHSYEDKEKIPESPTVLDSEDISPDDAIVKRFGFLGPALAKLFASGVEARGVERVPEDQRDGRNMWNNLLMWCHALATILCFAAVGAVATSFIATLGPRTGLRTMIITRYSSGYFGCTDLFHPEHTYAVRFSVTAVILGGQTLASINPGTLPLTAGVVIVGIGSLIPCFIGYNMVHHYERYAWMVIFIVMLFLLGLGGHAGFDINAQKQFEDTGKALSSDILSFGGIVFGSVAGWAPVAADYNCRLPADTPPVKIFTLTFFGLFIPITFCEIVGALLMTITNEAFSLPGKAEANLSSFLLAFSVIANNVPNTYSAALSIQALGRPFAKIPRFFWTLIIFIAYTVAGVAGREHFSEILSNFLAILSYWTAFFIVIVAEEHFLFRRPGGPLGGYNLDDWDKPSRLPLGIAGVLAGCFGVVGAVVGMAEVWYIGPLGVKAGAAFGADLGFELAAAFAGVTYPVFRWLEIRYTGR
ncbi:Cytosine-purine permease [Mycena sanguinolenta]|uniref:Cytosine-purine permease n=1 Tax=Mycena sanguinolenta TaxID=230812 RepID=A0A8H6U176_9AGAR|nr:Cytosine-purine permease [Mycena sanguinolenta]